MGFRDTKATCNTPDEARSVMTEVHNVETWAREFGCLDNTDFVLYVRAAEKVNPDFSSMILWWQFIEREIKLRNLLKGLC